MALAMAGIPATRRISDEIVEFSDGAASLADLVFGFFEEGQDSSESSSENSFRSDDCNNDDGDEDENPCNVEENKAFWKEQEQLLKGTLYRTSSIETKIRQATKEALREFRATDCNVCVCPRPLAGGCRNCLQRQICNRLINVGYNCAICKSKWRGTPHIPAGALQSIHHARLITAKNPFGFRAAHELEPILVSGQLILRGFKIWNENT